MLLKIGVELLTVNRSMRKADKSDTYDEIRKMLVVHVKSNTVEFTEVKGFRESEETANAFKQAQSNTQRNSNGANRGGGNRFNQTGHGDRQTVTRWRTGQVQTRSLTKRDKKLNQIGAQLLMIEVSEEAMMLIYNNAKSKPPARI